LLRQGSDQVEAEVQNLEQNRGSVA
jgi:hypothetical protein